jgi:SpoVK/Ycf46/Vps4 family AAA+-type ATPase
MLEQLKLLIRAKNPILSAETRDENRAVLTIRKAAEEMALPLYEWSLTAGLSRIRPAPTKIDLEDSKATTVLMRKGRFDEVFFVDLPSAAVRREILAIHLQQRKRDPKRFDLTVLAAATEGFSGAEIEQLVIAALYAAFSEGVEPTDAHLLAEARATRPLSVLMGEKVRQLRAWAEGRCVPAD